MDKTQPDQFTWSFPALNITSTFEISPQHSPISSEKCGLGWTFDLRDVDGGYTSDHGPFDLYMTFDAGFLSQTTYQLASVGCIIQARDDNATHLHKDDILLTPSLYIDQMDQYDTDYYRGPTLIFTVMLCPYPAAPSNPIAERISTITLNSLDGQHSVDTKVYAYTRRSNGGAINPRPFFIQSTIIDEYKCEPLSLLFGKAEGFHSEDALLDLHRLSESQEKLAALDYQDDSDFEDDDDVDAQGYPSDGPEPAEERYSISVVDSENAPAFSENKSAPNTFSSAAPDATLPQIVLNVSHTEVPHVELALQSRNSLRFGRVMVLSNGAYRTWRAIIRYIYTDAIQFAPLRSTKLPRPVPEACSPKSVYRIADEYGMETLKALAYKEIVGGITAENVVDELFSYFAHTYPNVHDHGMKILLEKKSVPTVKRGVMERFNTYGKGTMKPHENETMNKIMAQLM